MVIGSASLELERSRFLSRYRSVRWKIVSQGWTERVHPPIPARFRVELVSRFEQKRAVYRAARSTAALFLSLSLSLSLSLVAIDSGHSQSTYRQVLTRVD